MRASAMADLAARVITIEMAIKEAFDLCLQMTFEVFLSATALARMACKGVISHFVLSHSFKL